MSEELVHALIQLFAIIAKQCDGPSVAEREFVTNFLDAQLDRSTAQKYFNLFIEYSARKNADNRVSVTDSVTIIGTAKKINKILTQKQKIVVLIRILELIEADRSGFDVKYSITKTITVIFNISHADFLLIESLILTNAENSDENPDLLIINNESKISKALTRQREAQSDVQGYVSVLRIQSVNLFLFKAQGKIDVRWNGLEVRNGLVYVFAIGGMIQINHEKPFYFQEIISAFSSETNFQPISFNVNNLHYAFPNKNIGLKEINISEGPGKLIGIMGASGSGKTTLLNIISGIQRPSSGEVLLNGVNIHTESNQIKGVIGFVPQDDLLMEELTVYENLFYCASFCFSNLTEKEIEARVHNLLDSLGLAEIRNYKVGNVLNKVISGGQRKRLNIALELVREPAVLFLDEPTSGLSSRDSENIVKLLNQLALKGKLVFVVIHQPSSDIYKFFDKILLLDKGGFQIYYGNPIEAINYFKAIDKWVSKGLGECPSCGNINSESLFNIIEAETINEFGIHTGSRKISPEEWATFFKNKSELVKKEDVEELPPSSLRTPSALNQLFIYLRRDFWSKISNRQYVIINLLEIPLLAFILAFIIRYVSNTGTDRYIFRENDNLPAYIFMTIIVFLFMGISVSAEEIFKDSKILKREKFLHLNRSSYLLSKVTLLFVLSAIQSSLFVLIGNAIVEIHGLFLQYWLVLFSVSCCANLIGLNISAAFDSIVTIYILIPLLLIPQMILGGAIFSFEKLNKYIGGGYRVPYIAEAIPARWAYEALMVNQFKDNEFEKVFYNLEKKESSYNYKRGPYISRLLSITDQIPQFMTPYSRAKERQYASDKLELLQNELRKEMKLNPAVAFTEVENLTIANVNPDIIDKVRNYIGKLNTLYNSKLNGVVAQKEQLLYRLQADESRTQAFRKKKDAYYNDYLADVVKKSYSTKKLTESNKRIIQVIDPIYMEPEQRGSFNFRAHFFSPAKNFLSGYYDTFKFNLLMIWFFTLTFYFTLHFNLLRKIVSFRKV